MENSGISDDDVRKYCSLQLPESHASFAVLQEEFLLDPVNSRVGRYCRETEDIVRRVAAGHLNWEQLLVETAKSETLSEIADEGAARESGGETQGL